MRTELIHPRQEAIKKLESTVEDHIATLRRHKQLDIQEALASIVRRDIAFNGDADAATQMAPTEPEETRGVLTGYNYHSKENNRGISIDYFAEKFEDCVDIGWTSTRGPLDFTMLFGITPYHARNIDESPPEILLIKDGEPIILHDATGVVADVFDDRSVTHIDTAIRVNYVNRSLMYVPQDDGTAEISITGSDVTAEDIRWWLERTAANELKSDIDRIIACTLF